MVGKGSCPSAMGTWTGATGADGLPARHTEALVSLAVQAPCPAFAVW